jgi:hypothetical protein
VSAKGPVFPVAFDELAMVEDLARLGQEGAEALAARGREIDRLGGLPHERLLACEAEGRGGTRLGGRVKTYVPWPAGRFGAVMVAVRHAERPVGLRVGRFCLRRLICQFGSFPADSVAAADNELYTHFIPLAPDFSRSQNTRNGLFKPNRTPWDPLERAHNPEVAGSNPGPLFLKERFALFHTFR